MKIEMEATDNVTSIDGVEVRLWEGVTELGTRCKVFVHRIAVHKDEDATEFEKELQEKLPLGHAIPLSHIL